MFVKQPTVGAVLIWYAVVLVPFAFVARSAYGEFACAMVTPGVVVDSVETIAVALEAPLLLSVTVAVLHSFGSIRWLPLVTALPTSVSSGACDVTCTSNWLVRAAPQLSVTVGRIL